MFGHEVCILFVSEFFLLLSETLHAAVNARAAEQNHNVKIGN